jgi:hypothetical protein
VCLFLLYVFHSWMNVSARPHWVKVQADTRAIAYAVSIYVAHCSGLPGGADPVGHERKVQWRQWIRSRVRRAAPLLWVLEGKLACSARPHRYDIQFGGRIPTCCPSVLRRTTVCPISVRPAE